MKIKSIIAMTVCGLGLAIHAEVMSEGTKPELTHKKSITEQIAEKVEKRPKATLTTTIVDLAKLIGAIKADSTNRESAHCLLIMENITSIIHDFSDISAKYFSNRSKELANLAETIDTKLKNGDIDAFHLITSQILPIIDQLVGVIPSGAIKEQLLKVSAKITEVSNNCSGNRELQRAFEGL